MARSAKPAYPVADLGRVQEFMEGLEDAGNKQRDEARKAIITSALIYAGLRYASARRKQRRR